MQRSLHQQQDCRVYNVIIIIVAMVLHPSPISAFHSQGTSLIQSSKSRLGTSIYASNMNQLISNDDIRAGTDGYSVMRQPVQWDLDADPEFDVPSSLKEDEQVMEADSEWWTDMKSKNGKSSYKSRSGTADSDDDVEEELDLYRRTLDTLDFPRVLRALVKECSTFPARNIVKDATHFYKPAQKKPNRRIPKFMQNAYIPLTAVSVDGVQERFNAVREMQKLLPDFVDVTYGDDNDNLDDYYFRNRRGMKETLGGRPPPFRGMSFDLESVLQIADQGRVLEGPEILEISTMMDAFEDITLWARALERVESFSFVELPRIASCISLNTTLQDLLHNVFDEDGRLSGTTFPSIGALRTKVRTLKSSILSSLDGLISMPSVRSKLALESGGALYSEVSGRLVIPIEAKYASSVGIVHDTSRSGKTVYVEPTDIVGPTNELRQAESELQKEEARVWRSLTEQILKNRVELEASVNAVGQLDMVVARLQLGRKLNGIIPSVQNEGVISLHDAKHPVLLLREIQNVVGSDIDLGANKNQGLVLTGPNSGGKTVILKLLGLTALMVRSGIPIPAAAAATTTDYQPRVDFFDPVLADIGDIQSVGGDLSTFSGHMLVCREILSNSGRNALVLMDELGSGTDPNQGVAIAQALLEAILETGARVAITTHYMQLKQLATSDDRFAVAGMQFIRGRPTYKLLPGTVGESFALAVAERLQLPKVVIERATELLDTETRQMGDLIRDLEDQKALVDDQALELEEKKKEMGEMELRLKEEKVKLEKKQLNARRDEAKKFAKKLEEKEKVLEDILEKLKSDPSRRIVAKSWDDIKFVKRDAIYDAENVPSVVAQKKKEADAMEEARAELVPIAEMRQKPKLNPGDTLVICKSGGLFGREAKVAKELGGRRVEVQVAGMTVALKLTEVSLPTTTGTKIKQNSASFSGEMVSKRKSSVSKAAEKALEAEKNDVRMNQGSKKGQKMDASIKRSTVTVRTESNTVDVRGCNFIEAQEKLRVKSSSLLMSGRSSLYVLHGHGSGGILKNKLRNWLKREKDFVKAWKPADQSDGGDAFTFIELR